MQQQAGISYDERDLLQDTGSNGCPQRVWVDGVGGFLIGLLGGTVWWGVKAYNFAKYSWQKTAQNVPLPPHIPRRVMAYYRLKYQIQAGLRLFMRKYGRLAFTFGLWGLLFGLYDCFILAFRQRAHPFNHLAAGFLTGVTISLRLKVMGFRRLVFSGIIGATLMGGFEIIFRDPILWRTEDSPSPLDGLSEQEKIRYIAEDPNFHDLIESWEKMLDLPEPEEYPVMTMRDWEKLVYVYPTDYPPWKDIPPGEPDPIPGQWIPPPSYYRNDK